MHFRKQTPHYKLIRILGSGVMDIFFKENFHLDLYRIINITTELSFLVDSPSLSGGDCGQQSLFLQLGQLRMPAKPFRSHRWLDVQKITKLKCVYTSFFLQQITTAKNKVDKIS